MTRSRVSLLVAILAALVWAPSSAFAATPNQLSQATVTPLSEETSNLFAVMVRYRSPDGNPATGVSARAGGVLTAMLLVSGSTTDGIWSGTAALPPGVWDITIEATVASGSRPSLLAGTVTVTDGQAPTAPNGEAPASGYGPGGGDGGSSPSPVTQALATPAPAVTATAAPAIGRLVAPLQPPIQPARGGAAAARPGRRAPASARSRRVDLTDRSASAQRSPAATPSLAGTPTPGRDAGDLWLFMLIGTTAVGMVALVGSAWVVVSGRRDRRTAADPGVTAAAIVDRRAVRRARLRSADDPILAAMGLPDEDAASGPTPPSPGTSPRRGGSRRTKR